MGRIRGHYCGKCDRFWVYSDCFEHCYKIPANCPSCTHTYVKLSWWSYYDPIADSSKKVGETIITVDGAW